jgi:hypothetical protein
MLRLFAIIFGIAFLGAGILGFSPEYAPNNFLLGSFHVNAVHNLVHIITGVFALWVGFSSFYATRLFFQIFGVVYLLVAILGFYYGENHIFGLIANNIADAWLHLTIAITSLFFGFCSEPAKK